MIPSSSARAILVAVIAIAAVVGSLVLPASGYAAQHKWGAAHRAWSLETPTQAIEQRIQPRAASPASFITLQTYLDGGSSAYIGLQQDSTIASRQVRFSVWNARGAIASPGGSCRTFGGEGIGYTCTLPFWFALNRSYTLRIVREGAGWGGQVWKGVARDEVTGRSYLVGTIIARPADSAVVGAVSWLEYFGDARPCNAVPYTAAHFARPVIRGGASLAPTTATQGSCSGARHQLLSHGGVSIELGAR